MGKIVFSFISPASNPLARGPLAITATLLSIILGSVGAYALSRFNFRPILIFGQISLMSYMLPEVLIVIPLYVYIVNFGLADTLTSLVLANIAFTLPLTLWFMRAGTMK